MSDAQPLQRASAVHLQRCVDAAAEHQTAGDELGRGLFQCPNTKPRGQALHARELQGGQGGAVDDRLNHAIERAGAIPWGVDAPDKEHDSAGGKNHRRRTGVTENLDLGRAGHAVRQATRANRRAFAGGPAYLSSRIWRTRRPVTVPLIHTAKYERLLEDPEFLRLVDAGGNPSVIARLRNLPYDLVPNARYASAGTASVRNQSRRGSGSRSGGRTRRSGS